MIASNLILLQFLYGAALTDLYDRRIPNLLIGTYLSLGMFLNFRCISFMEKNGVPDFFFPLTFLTQFLIIGMMLSVITAMTHAGAGDAKLLALLLSWTGFYEGIRLLLPGLLLALAFILISKAETDLSAPGFRYGNTLTPGGIKRSIPFLNPYVPPILLRTVPYKSGKNKIFCLKNKLLRDFGAYIRIPKRRSLPLAVPVFLGAIPRLITYCFQ
ncbi:prepilin peptidase [Oribacterium sp. P6A1]|uniref:prepilin peptidase n=1 Tax=Oribacterium sp. P6A1 TaxID=1410612 RepID=UPI0005687125|nr:A24 family peptidase [Oribacterium sp. P6A1]